MDRTSKESFVTELRDRINRAPVLYLTDFTGLSVKQMTTLRRSLRDSGAEYVVVKNRLAMRALADTELPDISGSLEGPTGMVFGYEDAVGAAKAVTDFAKQHNERPVFKLGVLDSKVLAPEQITRIAKLPSKDELYAELAGAMEAPLTALAGALGAKLQETAGLVDALKAEREATGS
ncbi:MAG: 50S ribosomal protein L10 [Gemmatimonadota bacterium]|nr:50S ribosomal protein L10 [Gemmatimonadota bacterium]